MSEPGRRDPAPAAALPAETGAPIPTPDELRDALHPAALPLPTPRTPVQLAARLRDLLATDRSENAARLLAACGDLVTRADSSPAELLALARAEARLHEASGRTDRLAAVNGRIISLLRRTGHRDQAEVVGEIMSRGLHPARGATGESSTGGRRARTEHTVDPDVRALVRGLAEAPPGAPRRTSAELDRFDAALEALPRAQHRVLGASEPLLRGRRAQLLLGLGRAEEAAGDALDVLEVIERAEPDPVGRAERAGLVAHTVLARALRDAQPIAATHHAIGALAEMTDVDDPRLRIDLILDLLKALVAAGLHDQASFTAGRLASLQRTLAHEQDRVEPLLAVAAQRLSVGRLDAALVPLHDARRIAQQHRDHRGMLTAARLAGSIRQRAGDAEAALDEHRRAHREARRLVDDLATPRGERGELLIAELESAALVLRHALELGRWDLADTFAQIMLERTGPGVGEGLLPAALLWDHRVDAAIGRMLAAGLRPDGGAYEDRRTEAMRLILVPPDGVAERVRFWSVYQDDRHAMVLAHQGHTERALAAARRARDGWVALGEDEHAERVGGEIARLEGVLEGA